ncbi:hypothetical protein Y032_0079g1299 [Ancylostoma ceylanicum]|uniref:Uncharacterized protein n=1 Tax=Ancylostoma ceylanicum TaxID=53326 RepID=A0A016TT92_9BILA|nr:hypothetical protein Y032_0079g1299 [Ancylostoma ceylanicum]
MDFRNREASTATGRPDDGADPSEHPHEVADGRDPRLQRGHHRSARVAVLLLSRSALPCVTKLVAFF